MNHDGPKQGGGGDEVQRPKESKRSTIIYRILELLQKLREGLRAYRETTDRIIEERNRLGVDRVT